MSLRFTDIHHHLLYGMDDGAKSEQVMYEMIEKAAADGIRRIVATPHATPGMEPFNREQYDKALEDARRYCRINRPEMEILAGAEILYTEQTPRFLLEGQIPTMADTDLVLVEFLTDIRFEEMEEAIRHLFANGYRVIVAHIERYDCLVKNPSRAVRLKEEFDVLYQVNCSAIVESKGFFVRRFLNQMLKQELVDAVASDAHGLNVRIVKMKQAWRILKYQCGAEYARKLLSGWVLGSRTEEDI